MRKTMKNRMFTKIGITLIVFLATVFAGEKEIVLTAAKNPVAAKNGMVVSTQRLASEAGIEILKKGGNAVDAAVAVSYALAVVHPSAGNIGGGGFFVVYFPDGSSSTVDYREKAPAKAHRDMYLDDKAELIKGMSTSTIYASGVPGTPKGTLLALEKYGTMSRKDVLAPAIRLAEKGFELPPGLARSLSRSKKRFSKYPSTAKIYSKDGGFEPGELFKQPELAKTLKEIADKGADGFYKGWVADKIVETMKEYDGLITHEDLENYNAVIREPIKGNYRGYEIISMGPPSSGGIALTQLLNIMERYKVKELGWNSSETVHLMVEAERRVYADRTEYLGDSDFIQIPTNDLLTKSYAEKRSKDISPYYATPSENVTHGKFGRPAPESEETTHYSVIDKDGMSVAVTTTLNGGYGNAIVVEGAGFLLNNEMDDFSSKPGAPNMYGLIGSEANSVQPNKRMLSSMTPTIVLKDGKPFMIVGSPGGSTIITTVFQCIMNVIDHGMDIQEAVAASRFHHQWLPDLISYEKYGFSRDVIRNLEMKGHSLRMRYSIGDAHGILIDPKTGIYYGGADTRMEGAAVGY
ncbi:MAG: gamma-glutamyltransferase [bacterium]|nr:gamma-glutamyltransferase [bacterium]